MYEYKNINDMFKDFLHREGCIDKFTSNLINMRGFIDIDHYINSFNASSNDYKELVSAAFCWGDTQEHGFYWSDIALAWHTFYDKYGKAEPTASFNSIW